ncbi:metal ABC transporter solute-binding protein, Zn/Mn family [Mangrovibacillus cuniculi]|uniref:Zinc ABC transporter solute-binding protein n=1 Tax=Mangrovibacillus cuniculi TaxID=2593652 RepID=A0A7S8HF81_9BACI|nr:zinc ABC transporter substrate-binding protein [Mangrovibacillus cuniculi]QPC46639.1 zinc ABC transporter solute-binding protein [Mangrovibacillus cuniculi]
MKKWFNLTLLFLSLGFFLMGCSQGEEAEGDSTDKLKITTTIGQIADAASVIGGDKVEVTSLMGPGIDPHLYQATQSDIQKLQQADIVFYNGLHLEGRMLEIFENINQTKPAVALGERVDASELLEDEADTKYSDPHVWFNIDLWKQAISGITETLSEVDQENADYYKENQDNYFKELDELNEYAKNKMQEIPEEQRVLVTAHDAFNYFGAAFDLEVKGLQGLSTESEFGIGDIQAIVDLLVERQIKAVFVETSVSDEAISSVMEGAKKAGLDVSIGGEIYSDAMGEEGTEEGTYLGMYRHNVDTIVEALK